MSGGSGLSSRVLSMKFMKEADKRKEDEVKDEETRKHLDASQWSLSSSKAVINRMKHQKKKIRKVGYSTVSSSLYATQDLSSNSKGDLPDSQEEVLLPVGRREFGANVAEPSTSANNRKSTKKRTTEDTENGIIYQEDSDNDEEDEEAEAESNSHPSNNNSKKQQAGSLIELWAANRSQKKRPISSDSKESDESSNKKNKKSRKNSSS